jgi:hypothetical protein
MRPVAIFPKITEDPKFHSQCPLESSVKPSDLVDRVLDASITVSARKILAASPKIRKQFKDLVTSKRVSANIEKLRRLMHFSRDIWILTPRPFPSTSGNTNSRVPLLSIPSRFASYTPCLVPELSPMIS